MMSRPSAKSMDMGAPLNLGALAGPPSDVELSDEELARRAAIPPMPAAEPPRMPRIRNPMDDEEPIYGDLHDMTPEQIKAELEELERREQVALLRQQLATKRAKLREIEEARSAVPEHDPVRDAPQTWMLVPESAPEAVLCEDWVAEHCPVKLDQGAIVAELDLSMLRMDDAVICMVRGKGKRRPLTRLLQTEGPKGEVISTERPIEELMAQMVLTPAVRCADYWTSSAPGGRPARMGGRLNYAAFVEAIGAVCTPLAPRFTDTNSCKDGELPHKLVLREL